MGISVRKAQYSTLHLQRLVTQRRSLQLDAPQRLVWTKSQTVAFLEIILLGIPVPPIYLQETVNGQYRIVDGYNRIAAILQFLQNEVILENLPFLPHEEGKRFSQLDDALKGSFEDFQLSFYILPVEVEEELVCEFRGRVNGGMYSIET